MPPPHTLQITPSKDAPALTPAQKRFNTLIRQIEQARATLAAWQENVAAYRTAAAAVLLPLEKDLFDSDREWVFTVDELLGQKGWTGTERRTLAELLCDRAAELLDLRPDDLEVKALFNKHSDEDYDAQQRRAALAVKEAHEILTGVDLGDDEGIHTEEDLLQRMRQAWQQQAADAQAAEEARGARRRRKKTAAQQRREAEEQQATQSLREIYRKLASQLHPDRETDAAQRDAKTVLMQRVNQAYAAGDLLALLQLQLQVEQIDAEHMAGASDARLKQYNKVLEEQLGELQLEIHRVDAEWRMEFGVDPPAPLHPARLHTMLEKSERMLRADLANQERELQMLADVPALKKWLKKRRPRAPERQARFGSAG